MIGQFGDRSRTTSIIVLAIESGETIHLRTGEGGTAAL
jgi:hypothetical protein